MAKLQIKGKSLNPADLEILIDGVGITKLRSLELLFEPFEPNACRISFYVDEVEVDAEVLAELEAVVKKEKERGLNFETNQSRFNRLKPPSSL